MLFPAAGGALTAISARDWPRLPEAKPGPGRTRRNSVRCPDRCFSAGFIPWLLLGACRISGRTVSHSRGRLGRMGLQQPHGKTKTGNPCGAAFCCPARPSGQPARRPSLPFGIVRFHGLVPATDGSVVTVLLRLPAQWSTAPTNVPGYQGGGESHLNRNTACGTGRQSRDQPALELACVRFGPH